MTEFEAEARHGDTLAVCTIVSKNYLAYARVLAESLRRYHPDSHFFVLLVDRVDGAFDPRGEPFTLVEIEQLAIPDLPRFCFQYNVLELNTAAKPYFLSYLFEKYGARKVIYLDPDIMVFHDLNALSGLLDRHPIVLTPHMLAPLDDDRHPNELDILKTGTYNLGFIALSRQPTTFPFLDWWQSRLYTGCQANFARGLFVDQRWIDLVPGYFAGVHISRDAGYNVAYWNLHERAVTLSDGQARVNDGPCYFFHFSGYNPLDPGRVSKYQERYEMADVGDARFLYEKYRERLLAHDFEAARRWPYAFGRFDNGVAIPDLVRRIYLKLGDEARAFGNPFAAGPDSFYQWLRPSPGRPLPPLLRDIRQSYPDLMHVFPKARYGVDEALFDDLPRDDTKRPFGVNLYGPFGANGIDGKAARALRRAVQAAGVPHAILDAACSSGKSACPYAVNLVVTPLADLPALRQARPEAFADRHNVAYWTGDGALPADARECLRSFAEIWAPSTFALDALAAAVSLPTHWLPFCVEKIEILSVNRDQLGLPPDAFVFLGRTPNVVDAFRRAFGDRSDVFLALVGDGAEQANVRRFDLTEMDALLSHSDAYVSLHRADGSGLELLEALAAGKPVLATDFGACQDFLNEENGLPVRCRVSETDGAEPDLDHAAEQMRRAVEDRALAATLGRHGQEVVTRELSAETVGELLRERLLSLRERPANDVALRSAAILDGLQELRDATLRLPDRAPTLMGRLLGAAKKMARHLLPPVLDRQAVYNARVFDAVARLSEQVERQQRDMTALARDDVRRKFRQAG